jgi:hypothetical protein
MVLKSMEPDNTAQDSSRVASNIEKYLNNHVRGGSRAWQHNMVARPAQWHILPDGPRSSEDD